MTSKEYIEGYPSRLEQFLNANPDGSEEDYIKIEKDKFDSVVMFFENRDLFIEGGEYTIATPPSQSDYLSANKILDFLNGRLTELQPEKATLDEINPPTTNFLGTAANFDLRAKTLDEYLSQTHPFSKLNQRLVERFLKVEHQEKSRILIILTALYTAYYKLACTDESILFNNKIIGLDEYDTLSTYQFLLLLKAIGTAHYPDGEIGPNVLKRRNKIPALNRIMEQLEAQLPYPDIVRPEGKFNFANLEKFLLSIEDLKEKQMLLIEVQAEYKKHLIDATLPWEKEVDPQKTDFIRKCQIELEKFDSLIPKISVEDQKSFIREESPKISTTPTFKEYKEGFENRMNDWLAMRTDATKLEFIEKEDDSCQFTMYIFENGIPLGDGRVELGEFEYTDEIPEAEYYTAKRILEFLTAEKEKYIEKEPSGLTNANFAEQEKQKEIEAQDTAERWEKDKATILKHLSPLNGKWNKRLTIIDNDNFKKLVGYMNDMVKMSKLPDNVTQVIVTPNTVSMEFIRYTFYLLHYELYGRWKRDYWFTFLHTAFEQLFKGYEKSTTKKHFATFRPDYESYKKNITC